MIDQLNEEIDSNALLLWLYGAPGTGRLAIAYSLTLICEKYGCLLVTFFSGKLRRNLVTLLATIAYQMARGVLAARSQIEASLDVDPMIFHQSVDAQLAKFITEPLGRLPSTGFDFKDSPLLSSSTAWMNIEITTYNLGS